MKRPSIKDVAKHSGTSISTVSNVLNDRCYVSEDLRGRVLASVKELGYVANPVARNLKGRRSGVIGVVVTDINRVFFPPMLKGIYNSLSKTEYNLTLYDTQDDAEKELQCIRLMHSNWSDGLILDTVAAYRHPELFRELVADDTKTGMPIISVENDLTHLGIDSVIIDNRSGAYTATSHLIEMGCRRIVYIKGAEGSSVSPERFQGYKDALRDGQIPFDETLVLAGDYSPLSGYSCVSNLLRENVQIDGVFAANDQMAIGALQAIENRGLRVPQDVKLVGYDNTFVASIVHPALTTISVSSYHMGKEAVQLLLQRMDDPALTARKVTLDYELIIRRSTVASAKTRYDMTYW